MIEIDLHALAAGLALKQPGVPDGGLAEVPSEFVETVPDDNPGRSRA